jgi:hypothetical protein
MSNPDKKTHEELQAIFDAHSNMPINLQDKLSYKHMLLLAECFTGWAMDEQLSPEQSAEYLGMAGGMRSLAWVVGESWSPPEPERLCLTAFLARELEKKACE